MEWISTLKTSCLWGESPTSELQLLPEYTLLEISAQLFQTLNRPGTEPKLLVEILFPEFESGAEFVGLEALLSESDFVVVTCALTDETKNLFDRSKFQKMKKSAIFVNTSRGGECHTGPNCQVQGGGFRSRPVWTLKASNGDLFELSKNCQYCNCVSLRIWANQIFVTV